MKDIKFPTDPSADVDFLAPAIKAKITRFAQSAANYAFKGTAQTEKEREEYEDDYLVARYNLERTVKTHIDRVEKTLEREKKDHRDFRNKMGGRIRALEARIKELES